MALVVFLRGVNVGGHRVFRPSRLAEELRHLDTKNIGAAGTFVVRRPVPQTDLRREIEEKLPFETEILICRDREVRALLRRDPFADLPERKDEVRFVSVLAKAPRTETIPAALPVRGRWLVKVVGSEGRFVFGVHRREMKALGCLTELDRSFGAACTRRGWNAFVAIGEALGAGSDP